MKIWINESKLALIQEEVTAIQKLIDAFDLEAFIKDFGDSQEPLKENLHQIAALLQEAMNFIGQKRDIQAFEIQKFQKAMKYIKA